MGGRGKFQNCVRQKRRTLNEDKKLQDGYKGERINGGRVGSLKMNLECRSPSAVKDV